MTCGKARNQDLEREHKLFQISGNFIQALFPSTERFQNGQHVLLHSASGTAHCAKCGKRHKYLFPTPPPPPALMSSTDVFFLGLLSVHWNQSQTVKGSFAGGKKGQTNKHMAVSRHQAKHGRAVPNTIGSNAAAGTATETVIYKPARST